MNEVILIGRLVRAPELQYTPNTQTAVCRATIAVDRPKREGKESSADFIRCTVFGKQAESLTRYLNKGAQLAVRGRLQTGSYRNKNGETVYTTDVIADRVEFLGSANRAQEPRPTAEADPLPEPMQMGFEDVTDDFQSAENDIPF